MLTPTKTITRLTALTVIVLACLLRLPPAASAQTAVPPFVVEGRLLTQEFRTDTNLNYRTDASVVFLYRNGWWRVQARYSYLHLARGITNVADCMRIPDGTRSYLIFEGSTNQGLTTLATACRDAFPIPGQAELLVSWLALCPRPELPLIDSKRMRRFLNLPDYRPQIFNAPQNEGFYQASYLGPEHAFLSELVITNNGFGLELNVHKSGVEDPGEILRFGPPFDNGFTEMQYRVIESTNLQGIVFPLRAVCERFTPNWGGKDRNDLRVSLQSELTVTKISFSAKDRTGRFVAPSRMLAEDIRPGVSVSYLVRDDQWKPVADPEIARRARIAHQRAGSAE